MEVFPGAEKSDLNISGVHSPQQNQEGNPETREPFYCMHHTSNGNWIEKVPSWQSELSCFFNLWDL